MLSSLQQHLNDIYQVDRGYDVRDFLITDPELARSLSQGAMLTNTEETLLVAEDEDGLSLSLFLDNEMLDRLESANPMDRLEPHQLDDLWKVLEGVSHFNCVVWKERFEFGVELSCKGLIVGNDQCGLCNFSIMFAMEKVFPEPVTPSKVCDWFPDSIDSTKLLMASG